MQILEDKYTGKKYIDKSLLSIEIDNQEKICEFLNTKVTELEKCILDKVSIIKKLASKFIIVSNSDNLRPSYEILFNSNALKSEDEISNHIFKSFIQEYGLDSEELVEKIKEFKDIIHCIDLARKGITYCEVDIFGDDIKPVEC